jgi:hypothetical protein
LGFFRRHDETLNEQLLREAGLAADGTPLAEPTPTEATAADSESRPKPFLVAPAEPRGLGGLLGLDGPSVARPGLWDVVTTTDVAELKADRYEFAALPDGSLIVEDSCDEELSQLADAVELQLAPPYRAVAARQDERTWAVAANAIEVIELPGQAGDELELSRLGGSSTFAVDGKDVDPASAPRALQEAGERQASDFVAQARRLDETLWDVEVNPL